MHKCFCALRARAGESADIAAFCDGSDDDPSRRRKMTMPLLASGVHLKPAPGCAATQSSSAAAVRSDDACDDDRSARRRKEEEVNEGVWWWVVV